MSDESTFAMDSARKSDINGYVTIKRNPISRAGIFQYSGAQIGLDADPGKVYNVYRPAEEWEDPEALESVKHVPWIDDHVMLGGVDSDYTSPDKKGIHGITCDEVSFEDGVVYATLKVFSRTLADLVARGKKELSLGFRCAFEKASGVFDGQPYDYRQGRIRANHLALVQAGRAGREVAVLDHTTAFDHFDLALDTEEGIEMSDEAKPNVDLTELASIIKAAVESAVAPITARVDTLSEKLAADADERTRHEKEVAEAKAKAEEEAKRKEDELEKAKADAESKDDEAEKKKAEEDAAARVVAEKKDQELAAMDAKLSGALKIIAALDSKVTDVTKSTLKSIQLEAAAKANLASQMFPFTGVFDHSNMNTDELAAYGVEKLKIPVVEKGQELSALKAYLHNRPAPSANEALALDEAANTNSASANVKAFFRASK